MFNKEKIRAAAIWSSIEAISTVLLSFISIIYLARVLHPEDYGYVATAQIIASLIGLVFSFGLAEAIIQKKELNENIKQTAFSASILFGMGAVIISIVVFIVLYFSINEKIISYIYIFETLGIVFTILSLLPTGLLLRDLKVSAFTKRTLISKLLFFIVAIPLALKEYGVWSIVFGNFIQYFSAMIMIFWAVRKELPRKLSFDKKIFLELFSFGFYVMAENILWNVLSRVFSLLIALFHGSYALGLYNMASRLTDSVLGVLNTIISRMALPLFSQVQDDHSKLSNVFSKATYLFNIISMPAFTGMALTASYWVPIILGDTWRASIPIIQLIAIMYAVMYSRIFVGTAVKAVGQSKRFLILSAISAGLSVITVLLTKNLDIVATVASWAIVRIVVTIPLGMYLMYKILNIKYFSQLKPIVIPFSATIIMSVIMLFLFNFIPTSLNNDIFVLLSLIIISMVVYILSFYLLKKLVNIKSKDLK